MRDAIAALFLLTTALAAQISVSDVANIANAAVGTLTAEATITGTAGSTCILDKVASKTINAVWKCSNGANVVGPTIINATGTAAFVTWISFAEVLCAVAVNPTTSVSSLLAAPANGIAWQCTPGTGGTVTSGSVTWP